MMFWYAACTKDGTNLVKKLSKVKLHYNKYSTHQSGYDLEKCLALSKQLYFTLPTLKTDESSKALAK